MTCGVALQSVRHRSGVLILPCGRLRDGNLLRNHDRTVLVSLRYWMDATAACVMLGFAEFLASNVEQVSHLGGKHGEDRECLRNPVY